MKLRSRRWWLLAAAVTIAVSVVTASQALGGSDPGSCRSELGGSRTRTGKDLRRRWYGDSVSLFRPSPR